MKYIIEIDNKGENNGMLKDFLLDNNIEFKTSHEENNLSDVNISLNGKMTLGSEFQGVQIEILQSMLMAFKFHMESKHSKNKFEFEIVNHAPDTK